MTQNPKFNECSAGHSKNGELKICIWAMILSEYLARAVISSRFLSSSSKNTKSRNEKLCQSTIQLCASKVFLRLIVYIAITCKIPGLPFVSSHTRTIYDVTQIIHFFPMWSFFRALMSHTCHNESKREKVSLLGWKLSLLHILRLKIESPPPPTVPNSKC